MMTGGLPERAAASEILFENLLEQIPDAILITDNSGLILRVNEELERAFGYPRSELLGRPVELLVPGHFRPSQPECRLEFEDQPLRHRGVGRELVARRKDGSQFPVEIMLSPIDTPAGPFLLCVIRNI